MNLQNQIEEIIDSNYYNASMINIATRLENEWVKGYVIKNSEDFGHYELHECFEKDRYRIIRQCGDKQVGANTCLTSLYKEGKLLGTMRIFFNIDDNKLEIEASC